MERNIKRHWKSFDICGGVHNINLGKHDMNDISLDDWFRLLIDHGAKVEVFNRTRVVRGWDYKGRVLEEHLIYWILDGRMLAEWKGFRREFKGGDVLWLPPGRSHDFTLLTEEMEVIHIRFSTFLNILPKGGDHMICLGDPVSETNLMDLLMEWRQELPGREAMFLAGLVSFLIGLSRMHPDAEDGLGVSRRRKVMDILDRTPPREWRPSLLAENLGISKVYFSRLFIATFGIKPRTWLVREKMRRIANELVESPESIGRIALQWGYRDPYLFSRQFKGVYGESPKKWRARH